MILTAFTLLSACGPLVGNDHIVSSDRTVGSFRKVTIASGFKAVVSSGERAVTVRADENLMADIETILQGDELVVRVKEDSGPLEFHEQSVAISNDVLEGLDVSGGSVVQSFATAVDDFNLGASGGSIVHLSGLASTSLDLDASGGSEVHVAGTASRGDATASGGSTLDLTGVSLDTLQLDASGGSVVKACVATSLSGTASGGSTVTITGTPHESLERSGGSTLTNAAP